MKTPEYILDNKINTNELWYNYWWRKIVKKEHINWKTNITTDVYVPGRWNLVCILNWEI